MRRRYPGARRDGRTTCARGFRIFERQDVRSTTEHQPIAAGIERSRGFAGARVPGERAQSIVHREEHALEVVHSAGDHSAALARSHETCRKGDRCESRRFAMADRDVWTTKAELEAAQARRGVSDGVAEIERRRTDRTERIQPIEIVDEAVQTRGVAIRVRRRFRRIRRRVPAADSRP